MHNHTDTPLNYRHTELIFWINGTVFSAVCACGTVTFYHLCIIFQSVQWG